MLLQGNSDGNISRVIYPRSCTFLICRPVQPANEYNPYPVSTSPQGQNTKIALQALTATRICIFPPEAGVLEDIYWWSKETHIQGCRGWGPLLANIILIYGVLYITSKDKNNNVKLTLNHITSVKCRSQQLYSRICK